MSTALKGEEGIQIEAYSFTKKKSMTYSLEKELCSSTA